MSKLQWKLLIKNRESATRGVPPGKEGLAWVTNTVTLIYGQRDAVLVDTFLSAQHSKDLVDWVAESGKNLTTIYVTHAHGDHFFGLKLLLDRFPNAEAIAVASVVKAIRDQIKPEYVKSFWEPRFPGQIPQQLAAPEVLQGDTFYLEGEELKVVDLGHTDTSHTTALYVPSIGLVVSGDGVYNNTHLYLAERDDKTIDEWLQALDTIEVLRPNAVIAAMACSIPTARPGTSWKRAVTSATSPHRWRAHRPRRSCTRRCCRSIRTVLIPDRCGRPQKRRSHREGERHHDY
jgi:glyoxylase-like metal-dependent hydrolase (beta-lactamase superfamily II)